MSVTQTSSALNWCVGVCLWGGGGFLCPSQNRQAASMFPSNLSTAVIPFICSLFSHIFSQPSFLFFALAFSVSLNHCLPVTLSFALHLCSISCSVLCRSSRHGPTSEGFFFARCAPPLARPFWVVCVAFWWGLREPSTQYVGLSSVGLTSTVRVTGHGSVPASKEHTRSFTCIYWHTCTHMHIYCILNQEWKIYLSIYLHIFIQICAHTYIIYDDVCREVVVLNHHKWPRYDKELKLDRKRD